MSAPEAGWLPMETAPTDGTVIVGRYGDDEVKIRWAEERRLLAGVTSGAGLFGPGWEDVDTGLYIDDPERWRPAEVDQ